jgi:hypothetical protein
MPLATRWSHPAGERHAHDRGFALEPGVTRVPLSSAPWSGPRGVQRADRLGMKERVSDLGVRANLLA